MAMFLIAIIVLQFVGANFGAHQLHAASGLQESDNHPHLQFSAQVTVYTECVDCMCPNEQGLAKGGAIDHVAKFPFMAEPLGTPSFTVMADQVSADQHGVDAAPNQLQLSTMPVYGFHAHFVKSTQIQDFDLCLDCQCHGGHVALLTQLISQPLVAGESVYIASEFTYLAPDNYPKYRPPIA